VLFRSGALLGTADLPGATFLAPGVDNPVLDPDGDYIVTINSEYKKTNYLPGFGLIFEPVKKLTIRTAYSHTKGRPSMREVSPFINKSIDTQNLVIGNPAITPSSVDSYDIRVEWNSTPVDAVSVSFFYKEVESPIEKVLLTSVAGDVETWLNNPGTAEMTGLEFEFKHALSNWTELLEQFSLNGNFTYISAEVPEHPFALASSSAEFADPSKVPTSRRLFDQPEYIANADLTWRHERWGTSATFAAYAISDVLVASGLTNGVSEAGANFDLYSRAYTRYDLVLSQRMNKTFKVKFSVKNIFDPVLGTIYDPDALGREVVRNSYRAGQTYSISVSGEF